MRGSQFLCVQNLSSTFGYMHSIDNLVRQLPCDIVSIATMELTWTPVHLLAIILVA